MGVCIYPNSVCQDNAAAINVHRSIGLGGNLSSSLNEKKKFIRLYKSRR